MRASMEVVKAFRQEGRDAFYFNWQLYIEPEFQEPFEPTHTAMADLSWLLSRGYSDPAALKLVGDRHGLPPHRLAAQLRRAFSGIVAGNVKEEGIRAVEAYGPFEIHAEPEMAAATDDLLQRFMAQRRMKLQGEYTPCYTLVG